MLKKSDFTLFTKLFLAVLLLLAIPLAACGTLTDEAVAAPVAQQNSAVPLAVTEDSAPLGAASSAEANQKTIAHAASSASAITTADLSKDEIADLLFMREEEKLARDLYLAFAEQWGIPIFQNVAASEQAHMDALLALIEQYGLQDPVGSSGQGQFNDPALQDLYDQLLAAGSESTVAALYSGAAVEEIDILDLRSSLGLTNSAAIRAVYQNLWAGSENHLRAFVSSWERQTGETYLPQHLDQEYFDEIIGDDGRGSSNGSGQGQGQGGRGGRGQGSRGSGQGGQGQGRVDNGPGGPGGRGRQANSE